MSEEVRWTFEKEQLLERTAAALLKLEERLEKLENIVPVLAGRTLELVRYK